MELISRDEAIKTARMMIGLTADERENEIRAIPTIEERKEGEWIPLRFDGATTDFPHERDGKWVIVTDGKCVSVERIKKDAYDHFYPSGRWFEIEDAIAWMPLPLPPKGE